MNHFSKQNTWSTQVKRVMNNIKDMCAASLRKSGNIIHITYVLNPFLKKELLILPIKPTLINLTYVKPY